MYSREQKHIHFVGIGGIGMSGIATILKHQGYAISGCDLDVTQQSIHNLQQIGCHIYEGNNTPACHDATIDILVYSSALTACNPEIVMAQQRGIPTIQRAAMLAELMRTKQSVAIAGSHGKTTTTSLISHILLEAALDPTIIVGGHLQNISSNARFGQGDLLVAEADESDRSFLKLYPTLAVVTNIDFEHVDVYRNLDDVKQAFLLFLQNIPFYGKAFVCSDDEHVRSILPLHSIKTVKYGFDNEADISARDHILESRYSTCTIWRKGDITPLGSLYITMPGRHNLLNATAATAVALDLGVPFGTIAQAIGTFKGVERRFSFRGLYRNAELFDDYGHHPAEIEQTLIVARKRARGRLFVAFQPHRYTRTKTLWHDFIDTFLRHKIDGLVITDIYAASEQPLEGVHSKTFVEELACKAPFPVVYAPYDGSWQQVQHVLKEDMRPEEHDLILFLGAGKINRVAEKLLNKQT